MAGERRRQASHPPRTRPELVATARDDDAIAAELGADRVIYQRLDDLKKSVSDEAAEQGVPFQGLDCSCFDGVYVTGLGGDYLTELAQKRDVLPTV